MWSRASAATGSASSLTKARSLSPNASCATRTPGYRGAADCTAEEIAVMSSADAGAVIVMRCVSCNAETLTCSPPSSTGCCPEIALTPHVETSSLLNFGDSLVKAGNLTGARAAYRAAMTRAGFTTWKFASVVQSRMTEDLAARATLYQGSDPRMAADRRTGSSLHAVSRNLNSPLKVRHAVVDECAHARAKLATAWIEQVQLAGTCAPVGQ